MTVAADEPETETIVESDGSVTTITTTESDGEIHTKRVTTHAIVGGTTVDPEASRFIKTFDGFRTQLREVGLAKQVYALIEQLYGFLHKTTGVATPDVSDMQQ